jgi:hypothetical protein
MIQHLSAIQRESLRSVVFDANVFSEGRPNLRILTRQAAKLERAGLELWVPEPVAWEWAEHLGADLAGFRLRESTIAKKLELAGLGRPAAMSGPASKDEAVERVLSKLQRIRNLRVIPLTGSAAVAGLRDQILQTGAGKKKADVKTGASDSAWVRSVVEEAKGAATFVIVSNDRSDLISVFDAMEIVVPPILTLNALPEVLFQFATAPRYMSNLIVSYLQSVLPQRAFDDPHGEGSTIDLELGPLTGPKTMAGRYYDLTVNDLELRAIEQLMSVTKVEVEPADDNSKREVAFATIWLLGTVEVVGYQVGGHGEVDMQSESFYDVPIVADMEFEIVNGVITVAGPGGESRAILDTNEFDDADAALQHTWEILDLMPGFNLGEVSAVERHIDGHIVSIEFSGDRTDEWVLTLTIDNESVEVLAQYDGTAPFWAGEDTFNMFPPYSVVSIVNGHHSQGPYAVVAFSTSRLQT